MTTVLIVVAHPDDAEIAMGMRMHWYAVNGARVRVHCLTTGAPGPDGTAVRREECLNAGALLGVDRPVGSGPRITGLGQLPRLAKS
ncbi:MAG: PIG-L family deacetylase [Pseudonocardiaceae bacterium]